MMPPKVDVEEEEPEDEEEMAAQAADRELPDER